MKGSSVRRVGALGLASMMLIAACSSTPGATPTTAPTPAPTSGATPGPTQGGTATFQVAFTSVGLSSAPFLSALAKLSEQGYTIETPELAESELVTEGVASGQFQFGSGANNAVLAAVEAGTDLKVIVDRVKNEWTLYGRTETITECADFDGKRLAIHSEGAVSTAMVRNYIEQNCAGTEPEYIVIEGSPNRLAALVADQIDASPLELGDSVSLEAQAGDRFHLIDSLADSLPDLHPTSIYVNGEWAAENPDAVRAVVKAVIEEFRLIEGDAAYLQSIAEEQVPDAIDAETIEAATAKYVDLAMFPTDGGLTEDNVTYTAEFFGPDGTASVESVIPNEEWSDLSYLTSVLDELGSP